VSKRWPIEVIVAAIHDRQAKGLSLGRKALLLEDRSLLTAIELRFGHLGTALAAVGLIRGRWSVESVAAAILQRHAHGRSLAREAVLRDQADLYVAATRLFGTWETAVKRADPPVSFSERMSRWSPERIMQTLLECRQHGITLGVTELNRRNPALVKAAELYFGSLENARKAMHARGLALGELDADQVVQAIRERHSKGLSVAHTEVHRDSPALYLSARRHFGSWRRALAHAGVEIKRHPERRRWTPELVTAMLRERADKNLPLSGNALRTEDAGLLSAGVKLFGSWRMALRAAGIEEGRVPRSGRRSPASREAGQPTSGVSLSHHELG